MKRKPYLVNMQELMSCTDCHCFCSSTAPNSLNVLCADEIENVEKRLLLCRTTCDRRILWRGHRFGNRCGYWIVFWWWWRRSWL
jgi:hypothetical protein